MIQKKINKLIILTLSVLLLTTGTVTADSQGLTLRECIEIAFDNNPNIRIDRIDYQQAQNYYDRVKNTGDQDLIEEAEDRLKIAEERLQSTKKNVAESIEQKYYNWFQTEENLKAQKEALEYQEKQLITDEIKYEAGLISIVDITDSRNRLQDMEKSYDNSRESLKTQRMEFNQELGRDLEKEIKLIKEAYFDPLDLTLEESLEIALNNRNDIKGARKNLQEAEDNLKNIDNPYTPQIEIDKAETEVEKAKISLKQVEQSLLITVRRNYFSLKQSYENIEKAEEELKRARKQKEIAELQYEAGAISTGQILDAREAVLNAEENIIEAKRSANLEKRNYLNMLGVWDFDTYLKEIESFKSVEEFRKEFIGDINE